MSSLFRGKHEDIGNMSHTCAPALPSLRPDITAKETSQVAAWMTFNKKRSSSSHCYAKKSCIFVLKKFDNVLFSRTVALR